MLKLRGQQPVGGVQLSAAPRTADTVKAVGVEEVDAKGRRTGRVHRRLVIKAVKYGDRRGEGGDEPGRAKVPSVIAATAPKAAQKAFARLVAAEVVLNRLNIVESLVRAHDGKSNSRGGDVAVQAEVWADLLVSSAIGSGQLVALGPSTWQRVDRHRRLVTGDLVPELASNVHLSIATRAPAKWAMVDLETGDVWVGKPDGSLARAGEQPLSALVAVSGSVASASRASRASKVKGR